LRTLSLAGFAVTQVTGQIALRPICTRHHLNPETLINLIEMMGLNEENAAKAIACFEAHVENRVLEEVESIRKSVFEELSTKIDEYLGEHVTDAIEEAESEIEELKRMMVIGLTGGPEDDPQKGGFVESCCALACARA